MTKALYGFTALIVIAACIAQPLLLLALIGFAAVYVGLCWLGEKAMERKPADISSRDEP